jgi:hypothetical protein
MLRRVYARDPGLDVEDRRLVETVERIDVELPGFRIEGE